MKKTARKKSSKYTVNQLNRLAKSDNYIVLIEHNGSRFTLEAFEQLEVGDDYFDQQEIDEGFSGINAYVQEDVCRYPIESIDVFVAKKVKIK